MSDLTREQVIAAAREANKKSLGPLTRREFIRVTGISEWHIGRLFPEGRWTEIRTLAGIDRNPLDYDTKSSDELLVEFHRVVKQIWPRLTISRLNAKSTISYETYKRRFGGIKGTLRAYQSWLEDHDPDAEILKQIRTDSVHEIVAPSVMSNSASGGPPVKWSKRNGSQYGPPLDFRGLRHAPINEQGVVYLFGVVSYELGFIVEAIQGAFPDCDAKRHIGGDRWQRVRIEFEYRSRHFKEHSHDIEGADLIVCWIHDWLESPIEVLELKSAIDGLEA